MISDTIDLESLLGRYDSETILVGPLLSLSMNSSYRYFFVAGKGTKIYNCFSLGFIDNESDAQKQRAGTIEKLTSRFADVATFDSHAEMAQNVHARWQCEETARVLSSATIAIGADPPKFGGNHAATNGDKERTLLGQQNKRILDVPARELFPPAHSPASTTTDVSPTKQQRHFKLSPDDVTGEPAPATAEAPTRANVGLNPLASTAPTSKTEPTNVDVRQPINGMSYGPPLSGGHGEIVSVLSGLLDQTRFDKQRPIELPPATGLLPRLTDRENDLCARPPHRDFGLTQDDFAAAILSLKSPSRSDSLAIRSSELTSSQAPGIAILPAEPTTSQADIVTLPPVERTTGLPSKSLRFAILGAVIIFVWTLVPPSARQEVEESTPVGSLPPSTILNIGGDNPQSPAGVRRSSSSKFADPSAPRIQAVASSPAGSSSAAQPPGKRAPAAAPGLANSSLAEQPPEVEKTKATTPISSDWGASAAAPSEIASSPEAHGPETERAKTAIVAPATGQQEPGNVPNTVASLPASQPSRMESTKSGVGPVPRQPTPPMAAPSSVASPPPAQLSEVKSNGATVAPASGQPAPAAQKIGSATRLETDEIAKLVDRGMQSLKSGDLESARLSLRHAAEAISGPIAAPPISSEHATDVAPAKNSHNPETARPDQSGSVSETSQQTAPTPPVATVSKPSPPPQVATLDAGNAPVTVLTPSAPQDRMPRQLDSAEIARLLNRGTDFLENGDIASARLLLRRPAEAGNPDAALALGSTYDPLVLQQLGVVGVAPDVVRARKWYQKAADLGSGDASQRLAKLAQTGQ